jgi:hypothetical protein
LPGKHKQLNRISSIPKSATSAEAEVGSEARKGEAGLRDKAADAEQPLSKNAKPKHEPLESASRWSSDTEIEG